MLTGAKKETQVRRPREVRQAVLNLSTQEANWGAQVLAGVGGWTPGFPDLLCGNVSPTEPHLPIP